MRIEVMQMLTKEKRKEYFKVLGLGAYNTGNIYKLQKKYFENEKEWDGKYGSKTDILLVNLYRMNKHAPHFTLEEFKCHCGGKYCTGYPAKLSTNLLVNLEQLRLTFNSFVMISSGLRCKKWNSLQSGSATQSRHISGKAADIYGPLTSSKTKRTNVKSAWYDLPNANYCYYGTPNMGNSVHVDVK